MNSTWDAIGAISTAIATIVALVASTVALLGPIIEKRSNLRGSAREIIRAASEVFGILEEADKVVKSEHWSEESMDIIRARSSHIAETLNRLISRPFLSDGMIATGVGAMSIAAAISKIPSDSELRHRAAQRVPMNRAEAMGARFVSARPDAERIIAAQQSVALVVKDRMARVSSHHNLKPNLT